MKPTPLPRLLLVLLAMIVPAWPLHAQSLPATSDGTHLWIVRPGADGQTFVVLMRQRGQDASSVQKVLDRTGQLAPGGIASAQGRLWMIYAQRLVQTAGFGIDPQSRFLHPVSLRTENPLPAGVTLRSVAADEAGLWALVRVETRAALDALDAAGAEPALATAPAATRPVREATLPATAPAAAPVPATQADFAPVDRLLRLTRNQWSVAPLPEEWSAGSRATLLCPDPSDPAPVLVVQRPMSQGGWAVELHRSRVRLDGPLAWHAVGEYHLPPGAPLLATVVQKQILLARRLATPGKLDVQILVLRPELAQPIVLGSLSLEAASLDPAAALDGSASPEEWTVVEAESQVALIASLDDDRLAWTRMDLSGRLTAAPARLELAVPPLIQRTPGFFIMVGTLALATLMMFFFWRRDPQWNRLQLPRDTQLADFLPRAMAGLIDITPCLGVAMLMFSINVSDLLWLHWPGGRVDSWGAMLPGSAAIALFVLHTGLTELFTARTLGKMLMGLHVTTLSGGPPNLWQVLTRNLLKVIDLVAPPLLILPLIGPMRQRLGDMVARTVVTSAAAPDEEPPPEDEV